MSESHSMQRASRRLSDATQKVRRLSAKDREAVIAVERQVYAHEYQEPSILSKPACRMKTITTDR